MDDFKYQQIKQRIEKGYKVDHNFIRELEQLTSGLQQQSLKKSFKELEEKYIIANDKIFKLEAEKLTLQKRIDLLEHELEKAYNGTF